MTGYKKIVELRNITLTTDPKKGSSVFVDFEFCSKFKYHFTLVRGEILEQSMAIYNEIKKCLELLGIIPSVDNNGEEFMNLRDKLSSALKMNSQFKLSTKILRSNLYTVIIKRNIYAHADLGFHNNVPEIKYEDHQCGQTTEVIKPISEKDLKNDLEFFEKVKNDIRLLHDKIKNI